MTQGAGPYWRRVSEVTKSRETPSGRMKRLSLRLECGHGAERYIQIWKAVPGKTPVCAWCRHCEMERRTTRKDGTE